MTTKTLTENHPMAITKRQQQAIATKQKILDTAETLIGERGYDNVSVDDIVAACGVAKGTFYIYFKSKDELIVYIEHTPYEKMREEFNSIKGRPFEERLRYLLMRWFDIMAKFNIHFARQRLRHYVDPAYASLYGENTTQMDVGLEMVETFFEDAVKNGELRAETPVTTLAREITFSMEGCAIYHYKCEGTFPVMEWASTYCDLVVNTLVRPYLS
jgi:AcrR family transcriptional regulator